MGLPSLFKIPSHKVFDFKTRYYDAVKEEFEQRIERAKRDAGAGNVVNEKGEYIPAVKGQMRRYISHTYATKQRNSSSYRVLIIAVILSVIAYYIFYA